jgi:hypothetical protein
MGDGERGVVRVLDFGRSSVTFRVDLDRRMPLTISHKPPYALNNARVLLDSRLRVTEKANGRVHAFVLGVSCKTERVGAERDLWLLPNADFKPIFGDTEFMHMKTFARAGTVAQAWPPGSGEQSDRLRVAIDSTFDRVHLDLLEHDATRLTTAREIVDATLGYAPLVVILQIENARYAAMLEFPVKTMNANERDWVYQTDTGPVLWPDLDREPADLMAGLQLAYVAINSSAWADVIVRTRTAIGDGVEVYHYSNARRVDGIVNEFYSVPVTGEPQRRQVELPVAAGGQGA